MLKDEISIVPFDMKYLNDYYREFNAEITEFQWTDPFDNIEDAKALLQKFSEEMHAGKTLLFSVLSKEGAFIGSVEVHGLSDNCPELGLGLLNPSRTKDMHIMP